MPTVESKKTDTSYIYCFLVLKQYKNIQRYLGVWVNIANALSFSLEKYGKK